MALHELEQTEAADRCALCGLPKEICRDPGNQFRFESDAEQCHASYSIALAQKKREGNGESDQYTAWSARLKRPTI